MKFIRVALFCHRNLKYVQVRKISSCIYKENIGIGIYTKYNQSVVNLEFSTMLSERNYSKSTAEPTAIPIVYYDEIKDLPNHPEKLLIDVREPQELSETGKIPSSINIPLGDVVKALSVTSDDKFKTLYGKEKPENSSYIIFHCMGGKRSQMASESAVALGFTNVKNYKGSWLDWAEHEGLPK